MVYITYGDLSLKRVGGLMFMDNLYWFYCVQMLVYKDDREHTGSIKGLQFLDCLKDYRIPKKDCASWRY